MKVLTYLFMLLASQPLLSQEIVVRSPSNELVVIDVDHNDNFLDTIELLKSHLGAEEDYVVDFNKFPTEKSKKAGTHTPSRNYLANLTSGEKTDIRYIITTLGNASLVKIAKDRSSLRKAGYRVEHVHPLQFLLYVFTDEELKAGMQGLHGRTWVWDQFWGGLRDSFEYESNHGNLKIEFITDFASKIGINPDIIVPSINNHHWSQLMSILVDKVPRNKNADRYGM